MFKTISIVVGHLALICDDRNREVDVVYARPREAFLDPNASPVLENVCENLDHDLTKQDDYCGDVFLENNKLMLAYASVPGVLGT